MRKEDWNQINYNTFGNVPLYTELLFIKNNGDIVRGKIDKDYMVLIRKGNRYKRPGGAGGILVRKGRFAAA